MQQKELKSTASLIVTKEKFSFAAKDHDKQLRTSHFIVFPPRYLVIYFKDFILVLSSSFQSLPIKNIFFFFLFSDAEDISIEHHLVYLL